MIIDTISTHEQVEDLKIAKQVLKRMNMFHYKKTRKNDWNLSLI